MRRFSKNRFPSQQPGSPRIRVEAADNQFRVRLSCSDDFVFSGLVADFKLHLNPEQRRFDIDAKCWIVTVEALAQLREFVDTVQRDYDGKVLWPSAESPNGDEAVRSWGTD